MAFNVQKVPVNRYRHSPLYSYRNLSSETEGKQPDQAAQLGWAGVKMQACEF